MRALVFKPGWFTVHRGRSVTVGLNYLDSEVTDRQAFILRCRRAGWYGVAGFGKLEVGCCAQGSGCLVPPLLLSGR